MKVGAASGGNALLWNASQSLHSRWHLPSAVRLTAISLPVPYQERSDTQSGDTDVGSLWSQLLKFDDHFCVTYLADLGFPDKACAAAADRDQH